MSGFAGLLDFDGNLVDERLLRRFAESLRFRGPDAQRSWCPGRIGLVHALLRTSSESEHERQPCSLDADTWIVADARIDARSDLCRKLRSAGQPGLRDAPDAQLILQAYRAWGEDCVLHLLGDFSFAIWDGVREKLFCARDQLGVKPFFYARVDGGMVLSNTLNCIREHPGVSNGLCDRAIGDFLLFGVNQDPSSTAFAGIHRLAPAHRLSCANGILRVERYWEMPTAGRLRYRNADDYVDGFLEQLNSAVSDRLRSKRIGVLMSGGLDSTSVAASAKTLLSQQYDDFDLRAYTCVYDHMLGDEERAFATLAADSLGIRQHYLVADGYGLFERWQNGGLRLPEPADEPLAALYLDQTKQIAANSRVALTGWDGDALMNVGAGAPEGVLGKGLGVLRRAAGVGLRGLFPEHQQRGIGKLLARMRGSASPAEQCAPLIWIRADLVMRLSLHKRWRQVEAVSSAGGGQHGQAQRILTSPLFTSLLERYDPGVTRIPVEMRHPLLDLRVVAYILSLPVSPWRMDKALLRTAMRGRLPERVRRRPKSPLAADPVAELLQRADGRWVDGFEATPALERFVDRAAVPAIAGSKDSEQIWTALRPLCLNFWLRDTCWPEQTGRPGEIHEVA